MISIQNTSTETLHEIGKVIQGYQPFRNSFVDTLMNRIVLTIVRGADWQEPTAVFNKGELEYGEQIEEAFVNLAHPFKFDQDKAEKNLFVRHFPDVRVAFYILNYQYYYPTTVSEEMLHTAFLSWQQLSDFVSKQVQTLYVSMRYDNYIVTKYMLCRNILNGGFASVKVADFTSNNNLGDLIATAKGTHTLFTEFLKPDYNRAGVYNSAAKDDVYIFLDAMLDARVDVNVLANAFNMDKTEFLGHRITVDGWANHDTARLAELFGNDVSYQPFTADELEVLDGIGALMVDKGAIMIYDRLQQMETAYNGLGLYTNYFLHKWRWYAISPFANAVVLTKDTFTITGVEVQKDGTTVTTDTCKRGQSNVYDAVVSGTGVYNSAVAWSLEGATESGTYIMGGTLRVASNEPAGTELTLTATSIADTTQKATVTVTVQ